MNIREHSSKFLIYVFTPDIDQGAAIKVSLSQSGYEAYFFQDAHTFEERLGQAVPHALVFSTKAFAGSLNDFVEKVRNINDEIKFVAIAPLQQFEILSQYNSFGIEEILSDEKTALEARATWAVDRLCERLYLQFQNEQLFEDWKTAQAQIPEIKPIENSKSNKSVSTILNAYRSSQSKEDLIQNFMNEFQLPSVYFKFLNTVGSFVATHCYGFDSESIQGVGGHLQKDEIKNLNSYLILGKVPESFSHLLTQAFKFDLPKVFPLFVHNQLEGVVTTSGNVSADILNKMNEDFSLFSLSYSHFCLEKKVDQLEVQDFVTEVFNRNYFQKAVAGEVDRARRLQQPLSVVKISVDDFYEIEQTMGEAVRDSILKSLAGIMTRSSRTNDVTCRTQLNEFALILPHCSRKGAALRAERLRRIVESTNLIDNGMKISISLGISEYPGMCTSAESLDETSTKALGHIVDKGGNKICLYKASEDHKPEFVVNIE